MLRRRPFSLIWRFRTAHHRLWRAIRRLESERDAPDLRIRANDLPERLPANNNKRRVRLPGVPSRRRQIDNLPHGSGKCADQEETFVPLRPSRFGN